MQGSLNTEEAHAATSSMESAPYMGMFVGRWAGLRRQPIVILVLVFSDILLAIAIALAAFVLQAILGQAVFGRGQPTDIAITSMVANIITWVGLRTVIGLYPGYGLGPVEELRRQTLALLGTLTMSMTFAFALLIADSISRILLFAWALGLLVLAPLARHSVKWALMRASLWG